MAASDNSLFEKAKNTAANLNRRRQSASETSKQIVARREAFFGKLALMNVGALTFSVTLAGQVGANAHFPKTLSFACGFLLMAAGACWLRNLSHQHYQLRPHLEAIAQLFGVSLRTISLLPWLGGRT